MIKLSFSTAILVFASKVKQLRNQIAIKITPWYDIWNRDKYASKNSQNFKKATNFSAKLPKSVHFSSINDCLKIHYKWKSKSWEHPIVENFVCFEVIAGKILFFFYLKS